MESQFLPLKNWIFVVLETIKKDIKSEHLGSDPQFYRAHFGNRPQNRLTTEEIFAVYEKELLKGNRELAEWVVNRWVFKNGDLYQVFAERLSEIHPEFDKIQNITDQQSEKVLEGTVETFGAISTFLFVLLNGVVFPESVKAKLLKLAENERDMKSEQAQMNENKHGLEKILAAKDREIARLHDKIAGVQKKYDRDIGVLKKQIKVLQSK